MGASITIFSTPFGVKPVVRCHSLLVRTADPASHYRRCSSSLEMLALNGRAVSDFLLYGIQHHHGRHVSKHAKALTLRGRLDGRSREPWLDVSSYSTNWGRLLSPFLLGPVELDDGRSSLRNENAWQFSKVYRDQWDADALRPTSAWWTWSDAGFADERAHRFPRGRGAKPVGSWHDGSLLDYLSARRRIYVPLYRQAVLRSEAWAALREWFERTATPTVWEPDGRDLGSRGLLDAALDPTWPLGHSAVLAMMLQHEHEWDAFLDRWDLMLAERR